MRTRPGAISVRRKKVGRRRMLSSRALGLPNFSPKQQITQPPEIPISPNSSSTRKPANSLSNHSSTTNTDVTVESGRKPKKASAQLKHWSRARAIRSGRGLHRQGVSKAAGAAELVTRNGGGSQAPYSVTSSGDSDEVEKAMLGVKSIYIVSDGTGWTAENSVNAALGQFEHCLVDRGCPVNTHLFSGIEDVEQLIEVIKRAAKEEGMLVYTLADPSMSESARNACRLWGVPSTDVLGPITEAISAHLGRSPLGLPRGAPGRNPLTDEYFRRIEAIEFTIKQDDGALPQNLDKADIILSGVSRTGKTPLSIYLAQKGYKVANVPIVMGVSLPETLFQVDPRKVFGLTINQVVLQTIRTTRAKSLGFNDNMMGNYSKMDHVRRELEHAAKIFAQNPTWPVIEVTGKAIEETAAIVLRLYQDRKNKCSMPSISKRY